MFLNKRDLPPENCSIANLVISVYDRGKVKRTHEPLWNKI